MTPRPLVWAYVWMEVSCPRKGKQEKRASLVYLTSQATSQSRQDNRTCGSAPRKMGEPGADGVTPAARVLPGQPGSVFRPNSWPYSLGLRRPGMKGAKIARGSARQIRPGPETFSEDRLPPWATGPGALGWSASSTPPPRPPIPSPWSRIRLQTSAPRVRPPARRFAHPDNPRSRSEALQREPRQLPSPGRFYSARWTRPSPSRARAVSCPPTRAVGPAPCAARSCESTCPRGRRGRTRLPRATPCCLGRGDSKRRASCSATLKPRDLAR